jgi:2,3,4,5-tetrahydropyridine-2-carboxylate N-succinyltransferase
MSLGEYEWLPAWVEENVALPRDAKAPQYFDARFEHFLTALELGVIRSAVQSPDGAWRAVPWVKQGILLGFRFGRMVDMTPPLPRVERATMLGGATAPTEPVFRFFDKHTYPTRPLHLSDNVRIVPGGSTVRRGAHLGTGVVCMPPMYINVGAFVGNGTMIDSHALVGSCAYVGARVHLSAAAQIGGVLEPINATPVIIEDDVVVGGNCGVYEGTVVRTGAVLGAGVILTRGTPVFDLVRETVHRSSAEAPLEIPAGAVVVPGSRAVRGAWAASQGLALQTPVIVKYRDEKTDLATTLEGLLR